MRSATFHPRLRPAATATDSTPGTRPTRTATITALFGLAVLLTPWLGAAQLNAQEGIIAQCVWIRGSAVSVGEAECQNLEHRIVTLTGEIDLQTPDLDRSPDRALVSCWLCAGGACDESSPYGPGTFDYRWEVVPGRNSVSQPWEIGFALDPESWFEPESGTAPEPISQYYCRFEVARVGVGVSGSDGLRFAGGLEAPSFFTSSPHARAEQGTPLVAELSGGLPTRIGEVRD